MLVVLHKGSTAALYDHFCSTGIMIATYRFSVFITDIERGQFLPIHMLERLNIHFEVDWPFDVIFHSRAEVDYNRITQFLLQIKLAKYSLDRLQFAGKSMCRSFNQILCEG